MIASVLLLSVVISAEPSSAVPRLSLDSAVQEAVGASPMLRAGQHGVEVAQQRQAAASRILQDNPTLDLRGGPEVPNVLDGQVSVRLGQEFEGPWLRSARMTRATRERDRAQAEQSLGRLEVERSVRVAYAVAAWADDLLEARQMALQDAQQRADVIRQQVGLGHAAPMDLQTAEADQALQAAEVREAEVLRLGARAALARAMGRTSAVQEPLDPLPTERPRRGTFTAANHPEVMVLARDAAVAQATASEIRAEAIPKVRTFVSYQLNRNGFPAVYPAPVPRDALLGGTYEHQLVASVAFPIPVFNINGAEAAEARALSRQRQEEAAQARQRVEMERIQMEAQADAAAARILELKKALELAEQARQSAQEARAAGQFSLVDELMARDRALKARLDMLDARRDLADAEAELAAMDAVTAK
ncbi:MAG: TolC family protein [Myxococcota bacterium]